MYRCIGISLQLKLWGRCQLAAAMLRPSVAIVFYSFFNQRALDYICPRINAKRRVTRFEPACYHISEDSWHGIPSTHTLTDSKCKRKINIVQNNNKAWKKTLSEILINNLKKYCQHQTGGKFVLVTHTMHRNKKQRLEIEDWGGNYATPQIQLPHTVQEER